eukprot:CAMPEP_0172746802 /NCGR_PEP_ID=MMETSP1074-20121228/141447_1 /TAXON_ID=2916 /ORGANISM="Ceratium fusus, Strain PA161109" /LENGTH=108 /DNA_ID=CAMNT_0013578229 /DNA_START=22 /DNA_END=344 /DNA_ORIENTATION=+
MSAVMFASPSSEQFGFQQLLLQGANPVSQLAAPLLQIGHGLPTAIARGVCLDQHLFFRHLAKLIHCLLDLRLKALNLACRLHAGAGDNFVQWLSNADKVVLLQPTDCL